MGAVEVSFTAGPGIDEPLVEQRTSRVVFYEADGLRSVTTNTGRDGSIVNTYAFDSFGVVTDHWSPVENWYLYTGAGHNCGVPITRDAYGDSQRPNAAHLALSQ